MVLQVRNEDAALPGFPKEYRACLSSYVVVGVIFGGLLALWLTILLVRGMFPNWWMPICIVTCGWTFVLCWLSRFRLSIDAESVSYSSLFTHQKKIQRSEITIANFAKVKGPFESPYAFVIRTKAGEEIRINAKVFSLEAVRELAGLANVTEREWLRTLATAEEWAQFSIPPQGALRDIDSCMGRCGLLFAAACCRHVWHLLPDPRSRTAVSAAEMCADGLMNMAALKAAEQRALEAVEAHVQELPDMQFMVTPTYYAMRAASCLTGQNSGRRPISGAGTWTGEAMAWFLAPSPQDRAKRDEVKNDEARRQVMWLREIFGNPFHPITIDPVWLTSSVVTLAQAIYDDRAFDRMPHLADALEEAGCTNEDILNHCRQPGEHVRGCWLVDLILGKE